MPAPPPPCVLITRAITAVHVIMSGLQHLLAVFDKRLFEKVENEIMCRMVGPGEGLRGWGWGGEWGGGASVG